ncbi:MAG: helix-turn-helix transcriptional regulator [Ignavibacteriales bacterium]|nr:helix-turn-helix transcriptional regulator [Ignavibacteriales bacterium]
MKSFFHIFGVCFALLALTIPVAAHSGDYLLVSTITNCTLSITIFTLGYEGLFQEEVFSNKAALQIAVAEETPVQNAGDVQKMIEEAKQSAPGLLAFMEEKKPYLNEGLTLTELAKQVGMSRNQLSFVINSGIGDSFYTFINKYRVEEAKRLIADPKNANFTILSLAFEAGFPSKSSFHNVFKKLTGLTPTEYRNTLSQS